MILFVWNFLHNTYYQQCARMLRRATAAKQYRYRLLTLSNTSDRCF